MLTTQSHHFSRAEIEAAARRYSRSSRKVQQRILGELVATRSAELAQAYPNTLRLGIGVRRRRNHKGVNCSHADEPLCIVFMVARKWPDSRRRKRGGIPSLVLTISVDLRGRARLFAVPTD